MEMESDSEMTSLSAPPSKEEGEVQCWKVELVMERWRDEEEMEEDARMEEGEEEGMKE